MRFSLEFYPGVKLFEAGFGAQSGSRLGETVGEMGRRRMVDLGAAAFVLEARVGFRSSRKRVMVLRPVDEGGFVAPMEEFAHGRP